jgi:hypothetical protein
MSDVADKFMPGLSTYMPIIGSLFSVTGAILYGIWTLHNFVSGTDGRISMLEVNNNHVAEKIAQLSNSLQRQEDKIDKIYLIMSSKGNKNANLD